MKYKSIQNIITCDKCGMKQDINNDIRKVEGKDLCEDCYKEFIEIRERKAEKQYNKNYSVLDYLL